MVFLSFLLACLDQLSLGSSLQKCEAFLVATYFFAQNLNYLYPTSKALFLEQPQGSRNFCTKTLCFAWFIILVMIRHFVDLWDITVEEGWLILDESLRIKEGTNQERILEGDRKSVV